MAVTNVTQISYGTPQNEFCVVSNGAAPSFPTLNITNDQVGYDNKVISGSIYAQPTAGTTAQGANPLAGNIGGSPLLDPANDIVEYANPRVATVTGNPAANNFATYSALTKVLNNSIQGTLCWKNPA